MRERRYLPSPAMIVALIALFVAMGGTTYAVTKLPKRSVGPAQLKSKSVRFRHIKARNVTSSKIARNAITASLVRANALRGGDILESSLGTVPRATTATNADNAAKVGGRTVQKFAFNAGQGTGPTPVVGANGLSLTATCSAGPVLTVTASTSVSGSIIHSGGGHTGSSGWYAANDTFDVGDSFDVLASGVTGDTNLSGTLTYVRSDGEVVTATFLAQETATGCVFAGTAIG